MKQQKTRACAHLAERKLFEKLFQLLVALVDARFETRGHQRQIKG